jgi:hypothetical protein
MFVSSPLNNIVQNAIAAGEIEDLPQSMMQLDPPQERIAGSPPPLLIESRIGPGKMLVLLQHAAFYARYTSTAALLVLLPFLIVSKRSFRKSMTN